MFYEFSGDDCVKAFIRQGYGVSKTAYSRFIDERVESSHSFRDTVDTSNAQMR